MNWAPHNVEVKYGVITNSRGMIIPKSEVIVLIIIGSRAVRNSQGDPRIKISDSSIAVEISSS